MNISPNDKVGDIVTKFPKAIEVFQPLKIDYCCGGHRTLQEICVNQDLNCDTIIQELENMLESMPENHVDWSLATLDRLVNHILQTHHAYLYETLPILSMLVTKILRVHGDKHRELTELFQLFHQLKMDMDLHLIKEETIQYPAIAQYLRTEDSDDLIQAINIINELEDEHDHVGNILKRIREITTDYVIPEDVCETFEKTYQLLEDLEQNTFAHIHLENNILFSRIRGLR